MRTFVGFLITITVVLTLGAAAQAEAVCNDGTSRRASGQGACSQHGGVEYLIEDPNDPHTDIRLPEGKQDDNAALYLWLGGMGGAFAIFLIVDKFGGKRKKSSSDWPSA